MFLFVFKDFEWSSSFNNVERNISWTIRKIKVNCWSPHKISHFSFRVPFPSYIWKQSPLHQPFDLTHATTFQAPTRAPRIDSLPVESSQTVDFYYRTPEPSSTQFVHKFDNVRPDAIKLENGFSHYSAIKSGQFPPTHGPPWLIRSHITMKVSS